MSDADQLMAADREAARVMSEAAGGLIDAGGVVLPLPVAKFHKRLLDRMHAGLLGSIENGEPMTCSHVNLRTPSVVYWDAARPGRLVCSVCIAMTPATGEPVCALCGSDRGLFTGGHRMPITFPVAQVIQKWILCQDCMAAD